MKGMQKISRGSGFAGALKYIFADRGAKFLGTSQCMLGDDEASLLLEFGAAERLRPDIPKPVWHQSLRLPVGEVVAHKKQLCIVHDYMTRMAFNSQANQYCVVAHGDEHVHILASRVGLDGRIWYGRQENLISTRIIQELERDYDLQITPGLEYEESIDQITGVASFRIKHMEDRQPKVRRPKRKEEMRHARIQKERGTDELLPRLKVVAVLQDGLASAAHGGVGGFIKHVEANGVKVFTNWDFFKNKETVGGAARPSPSGKVGLVFEIDDHGSPRRFSGSQLGRNFSGPQLLTKLGATAENDLALLAQRTIKPPPPSLRGMFTDLKMQNAVQIVQSNLKKEEDEKRKRRARIEIIRDHLNAARTNIERAGDDLRTAEEHLETTRKFAKTDAGNPGRVAEAIQHFTNLRAVEHAVGTVGERLKQYFSELAAAVDRLKATVTALQQPDATLNTDASAEHARERMR